MQKNSGECGWLWCGAGRRIQIMPDLAIGQHPKSCNCATTLFHFQIDTTPGAKPQTAQTYGMALQQRVGLIWKWN